MGPETGHRTMDKVDFMLLPLVVCLWMSLILLAHTSRLATLVSSAYSYAFDQGCTNKGFYHEFLSSAVDCGALALSSYSVDFMAPLSSLASASLLATVLLPSLLARRKRTVYLGNNHRPRGRRLSELEDGKLQATISDLPIVVSLLGIFNVPSSWSLCASLPSPPQRCGGGYHGPASSTSLGPATVGYPVYVFWRWLFKPPDCYLARLVMLALVIGVYTVPLTCAATYLPDLFL